MLNGRVRAAQQSKKWRPARKSPMSPKVGRDMVAKLRPGKWYSAQTVAEDAGVTERDVHSVLQNMCYRPAHGAKAERKKVGNEIHYRIFKQDKAVSVEELTTKLRPIVEGPKAEGKKNMQQGSSQSPWARKAAAVHATGAVASDLGLGQRHRE